VTDVGFGEVMGRKEKKGKYSFSKEVLKCPTRG
jgi:hypothetical protein